MHAVLTPPKSDGPLTSQHHEEFALARQRARKIRKAAGVAALNGWAIGIFAAVSAPFALLSISGLLVTVGLAAVAYNEFRGRKRLLKFDPSAASLLGWNQLGLIGLISVYCMWMIYVGLTTPSAFAAQLQSQPEIEAALGPLDQFDELYKQLLVVVYGAVMLLSAVFQGLNALYYFTRRRYVEAYVRETPAWVLDVQRTL